MAYDVIVIGVGGMGSAAAYHLAARGQRVLGVDRFPPAHDKGSSHGASRIIRQAYFEDPAYVPLLLRSYELWERLATDAQRDVYRITGGLFIGPPDGPTVAGSLRASREWDLPHEMLDADEIRSRFPNFTPDPGDAALYEAKAGFARPELTVRAHIELAVRAGAELSFGEPVREWAETAGDVRVTTSRGSYSAGQLVICPGAWAPELLAEFRIPITVERQVLYWLDPVGGTASFAGQPIFIDEDSSGCRWRADSPVTGSNSSRCSGRSSPIWPPPDPRRIRSHCSIRGGWLATAWVDEQDAHLRLLSLRAGQIHTCPS
jgi:sarcosine oxidase